MARAVLVKSITTHKDQTVEVAYSAGDGAAPAGQSGTVIYPNQRALQNAIQAAERELTDHQLLLLQLSATWLQSDGTFGDSAAAVDKELRLDLRAQVRAG